jgi:hypothetical protein
VTSATVIRCAAAGRARHAALGSGVDGQDQLLAPEDLEHRVGLPVPVAQAGLERLLGVVRAADQLAAADVAPALGLRPVGDQVVVHPAARAQPPREHPAAHLVVGQLEVHDGVDVVALQEERSLHRVAREPVEDEPVVPVVLLQPLVHHLRDQVVTDQLAVRDDAAHLGTELRVVLHLPAEDVTDADLRQLEILGEHRGLGPLAAALDAHHHVLAHARTLTQVSARRGRMAG